MKAKFDCIQVLKCYSLFILFFIPTIFSVSLFKFSREAAGYYELVLLYHQPEFGPASDRLRSVRCMIILGENKLRLKDLHEEKQQTNKLINEHKIMTTFQCEETFYRCKAICIMEKTLPQAKEARGACA